MLQLDAVLFGVDETLRLRVNRTVPKDEQLVELLQWQMDNRIRELRKEMGLEYIPMINWSVEPLEKNGES